MRFLSLLFLCFLCQYSFAQKEIKLGELKDHIGDSVKVEGNIYGIRYLENANNAPTLINIGAVYPNQLLTIVIWGEDRKKFEFELSDKSNNGLAIVTGKVELYKGKPQIVVKELSQLVIKIDVIVPDKFSPLEIRSDN